MINEDYNFPEKEGQLSILTGKWLQYICRTPLINASGRADQPALKGLNNNPLTEGGGFLVKTDAVVCFLNNNHRLVFGGHRAPGGNLVAAGVPGTVQRLVAIVDEFFQ